MLHKFWFIKQCPLHHSCMGSNKKPKLWGWSLEEAQKNLRDHLRNSAKHYLSGPDATELVNQQEWEEDEQEVDEAETGDAADVGASAGMVDDGEQLGAKPQKRKRVSGGSSGSAGEDNVAVVARVVAETIKGMHHAQSSMMQSLPGPSMMPSLAGPSMMPSLAGDSVTLQRSQLQSMVDCCTRASHAARQAELLSASAARAFASESACLERCREFLQSQLQ